MEGTRLAAVLVGLAVPAAAPVAADAAFEPGRFVVEGKRLAKGAGKELSIYARPAAVSLEGCRTRKAKVRRAGTGVTVRASIRCGKRELKLVARVRGDRLSGELIKPGKDRRFKARRARRIGVLVNGKRSGKALTAVRDVARIERHPASEVSKLGGDRVARTELVLRLSKGTTIGEVNRALTSLGAGIVGSLKGSPMLIVALPDPGTATALKQIIRRLGQLPGVSRVSASAMAETQELPPGIASPPSSGQQGALSHLLASGVASAWNARAAIRPSDQPTTVLADSFGDGPLSRHVDARQRPRIRRNGNLRGSSHGYQTASIIYGDFASDGSAAGLVTGVFPARGQLVTVDTIDLTLPGAAHEIIRTLDSVPFHVVLSTSLGKNGGQADQDMFPEAADWIRDVVREQLQQRVFHATSAGNDARSATGNGLFAAAALRNDIQDYLTDGQVGPLTNALVVEGVTERADLSGLSCLFVNSNLDGTIAAPGEHVYSLDRDGHVASGADSNGTSFATPIVSGLATYLWAIAPDLTPQELKTAMTDNGQPVDPSEATCVSAPRLDAYAATLSLDAPGPPALAGWPVRRAVLDLDGDGKFEDQDLAAFAPAVAPTLTPTVRTRSRQDLNGDGFTGGSRTARFDLDRTGSTRAGASSYTNVTAQIEGEPKTYDEQGVRDVDVLCFYAYSPLYEGDATRRRDLLDGRCRPKVTVQPSSATVSIGASRQFTATVTGASSQGVVWSATGGTITQTGNFTAGPTSGGFTVTATSIEDSGAKGTAAVTIPSGAVQILTRRSRTTASADAGAIACSVNASDHEDDPDPLDSQDFTGAGPLTQTRHASASAIVAADPDGGPNGGPCPAGEGHAETDHSADHDAAVTSKGIDLSVSGTWTVTANEDSGELAAGSGSGFGLAELDVTFQTAGPLEVSCLVNFPGTSHTHGTARIVLDNSAKVANPTTPSFVTTVSAGEHRLLLQAFPGGDGGTSSSGTYALTCVTP
jgi:hypothetical protein